MHKMLTFKQHAHKANTHKYARIYIYLYIYLYIFSCTQTHV